MKTAEVIELYKVLFGKKSTKEQKGQMVSKYAGRLVIKHLLRSPLRTQAEDTEGGVLASAFPKARESKYALGLVDGDQIHEIATHLTEEHIQYLKDLGIISGYVTSF